MVLKYITDFVKDSRHINIILLSVPHRHNLMESSRVNNEIRLENEIRKTFKHTTVLEINTNWECFTLHGLHLNG